MCRYDVLGIINAYVTSSTIRETGSVIHLNVYYDS